MFDDKNDVRHLLLGLTKLYRILYILHQYLLTVT